ncbi:MAG: hypothetical protein U0166_00085 [Acidobacteriota bacterium]
MDVARVLARCGAGDVDGGPTARTYLYRADLAGRSKVVSAIAARMPMLGEGGGAIRISGERGVGKTRVALG